MIGRSREPGLDSKPRTTTTTTMTESVMLTSCSYPLSRFSKRKSTASHVGRTPFQGETVDFQTPMSFSGLYRVFA